MRRFRRAEIDFVFVDGAPRQPHLIGKSRERVGVSQHRMQCTFFEQRFAYAEKHLSGKIRKNNAIFAVDDKNDVRETLDQRLEIERPGALGHLFPGLPPGAHRIKQTGFAR